MKIFSPLYQSVMQWSRHKYAPWYLSGLSFAESSFFPVPPDVMLAPMSLAQPDKAWKFALLTTIASVLGGGVGYVLGMFAFEFIQPYIIALGYQARYELAKQWFEEWGVWVVFIAGFSPIPYKVFTITAGVASMAFLPFLMASLIGRGGRFFLVAGLMYWGGVKMEALLKQYVDILGWLVVVLMILVYLWLR